MAIDNVQLFNKLTHSKDGVVDEQLFEELLSNFKNYKLFYNTLNRLNFVKHQVDKSTMNETGIIYLNLIFENQANVNKAISFFKTNNYIIFKGNRYYICINKNIDENKKLSLYFNNKGCE